MMRFRTKLGSSFRMMGSACGLLQTQHRSFSQLKRQKWLRACPHVWHPFQPRANKVELFGCVSVFADSHDITHRTYLATSGCSGQVCGEENIHERLLLL